MKLSFRSYPHPVLGNSDDVLDSAFQSVIEHSLDKDNLYLQIETVCSNASLNALIEEKRATFTLHVECSNTFYRKLWKFSENTFRYTIPLDELCDAVEVNVAICASLPITDYSIDGIHPDYGEALFQIATGDFLAISQGIIIDISPDYDALGNVGSIMEIHSSSTDGDKPVEYELGGDKMLIVLSKTDYTEYNKIRRSPDAVASLTCAIVLPALMEGINRIRQEAVTEEDEHPRWHRVLKERIEGLGANAIQRESSKIAQQLLELPIKRALASSIRVLENQS